jgi:uncharacterized membrane protein
MQFQLSQAQAQVSLYVSSSVELFLASSRKCLSASRRLIRALPGVYLVWVIAVGLVIAVVTPPWQNPDEIVHFLRADQVSHGTFIGYRLTPERNNVGGIVDASISPAVSPFNGIPFHAETKDTAAREAAARTIKWSEGTSVSAFPNTSVYPPLFYLPGAMAIWLGKAAHWRVTDTLVAARIANLLVSAAMTVAGLWLSGRTRLALTAVAILPMNIALMASAQIDGPILAVVVLAVGQIDRLTADGNLGGRSRGLALVTGLLACASMARPPYLFLLGLASMAAGGSQRRAWTAMSVGLACVAAWIALIAPIAPSFGASDPSAQISFLLHNPLAVFSVAANTLRTVSPFYLDSFIGVLGWLDTDLPSWLRNVAEATIVLAFAAALATPARRYSWLALSLVLLCAAAIFGVEYLTWTAPGGAIVEGVQGRYFIPLASATALAIPALPALGRWIEPAAVAAVIVLMIVIPPTVIHGLVVRYYLG